MNQTVGEWIESSIPDRTVVVPPYPDTVLARWALGPGRLWMLGVAVMLLFVGFVLGPSTPSIPALSAVAAWRRAPRAGAIAALGAEPEVASTVRDLEVETATVSDGEEAEPAALDVIEEEPMEADVEPAAEVVPEAIAERYPEELAEADDVEEQESPSVDPDVDAAESVDSRRFDLVEAKSMSFDSTDTGSVIEELRATELELWSASETHGNWCAAEYLDQMPPEESVASCDDVTLAFLDEADGVIDADGDRGAD
jgi:hypothetical protein